MATPGPKPKSIDTLDPTVAKTILSAARKGLAPATAAASAGIGMREWERWRRHATNKVEPFAGFFDLLRGAKAQLTLELLESVHEAAAEDYKAAQWLLERVDAPNFNPQAIVETKKVVEAMVDAIVAEFRYEPELTRRIFDALRRGGGIDVEDLTPDPVVPEKKPESGAAH